MNISKEIYNRQILTNKGIKKISEVNIGDYVYEWRTSRLLEIKDIWMMNYENMYEITYSDGRVEFLTSNEALYLDDILSPRHFPSCECKVTGDFPLHLFPVIFDSRHFKRSNNLHPYDAGINWYKGQDIIFDDYMYQSYKDRRQFIRGIFDTAYSPYLSPDEVSLFDVKFDKFKQIQKLLASMGIKSNIYRANKINMWKLQVESHFKYYPGFFYEIDYIEKMIDTDRTVLKLDPHFQVVVTKVTPLENNNCFTHNQVPHIVLEKPNMIYTSTNFLPRVSI